MIFTTRSTARTVILGALVALGALAAHADTLTLTNVGNGASTAGEYVGPYGITVQQYPGVLENLLCLDIDRDISVGESWNASASQLSVNSSGDDKTAALIISAEEHGQIDQVTAQLDIWGLLDATAAINDGLTQADISQLNVYELEALNDYGGNAFYNQFTLETAVPGTQSGGGTAQDFLGDFSGTPQPPVPIAPTPEPSSLVLLGTGLVAAATTLRRRVRV
jgi:hypothetical protein